MLNNLVLYSINVLFVSNNKKKDTTDVSKI